MAEESKEAFLHRWSRRKHQAEKEKEPLAPAEAEPARELPPVGELTPESDFTGFMQPKVEDALRRVALKKLFNDPHFNTPDPFEPFSGDWTVAETIAPDMLATLNQSKTLLFSEEKKKEESPQEPEPETQEAAKPDEPGRQDA